MTEKEPPKGPNLTVFEGRKDKEGERSFFLTTADYFALSGMQTTVMMILRTLVFRKEDIPVLIKGWRGHLDYAKKKIPELRESLLKQKRLSQADPNLAKNRPNFEEEMVMFSATLAEVENQIKAIELFLDNSSKD